MLTSSDLEALEKLLSEGTPAPWRQLGDGSIVQTKHITRDVWTIPHREADLPLIVALHGHAPELLRLARLGMEAETAFQKGAAVGMDAAARVADTHAAHMRRIAYRKEAATADEIATLIRSLPLPEKPSLPPSPDTGGEK